MKLEIHFVVHVYSEDRIIDNVLLPHNKNYGINGKEIIAPLRKINGESIEISINKAFTVHDLWDIIDYKLYKVKRDYYQHDYLFYKFCCVHKYLVFNNLRYYIEDIDKPLVFFLKKMQKEKQNSIDIQILVNSNAGTVFKDDGIRYYMNSKEQGKHNIPHIHVDIKHEYFAVFSLIDGKQLSGDKLKKVYIKKIKEKIFDNKHQLLVYWNEHTDGLTVDLNQAFGIIDF